MASDDLTDLARRIVEAAHGESAADANAIQIRADEIAVGSGGEDLTAAGALYYARVEFVAGLLRERDAKRAGLTPNLLALAAEFLDKYADRLGNDGCNDWDWPANLTAAERVALTPEEYRKDFGDRSPPNWLAARMLADLLERAAD